jgi:SnoaL-like domain
MMRHSRACLVLPPAVLALLFVSVLALAACGGGKTASGTTPAAASSSPAASTSLPAASQEPTGEDQPVSGPLQKPIILTDGVYRWDEPGTASPAQTQAVAHRYADYVADTKELPGVGLYAANATLDFWPLGWRLQGARNIQRTYRQGASDPDAGWSWSERYQVLTAPGVAMCEGMFMGSREAAIWGPYLALLAVDGDRIAHEEVFLGDAGQPVTFCGSPPGPADTADVATEVATALGKALARRDGAALQPLLAGDVLFRDATIRHDVRGRDAVLSWLATVAPANVVKVKNRAPLVGPGWAVVRWTGRRSYKNWYLPNGVDESRNGATVIEVRDGKVVRMTLYLEPGDGGGSILRPE